MIVALVGVVACGSDDAVPDAGPDASSVGTLSFSWEVTNLVSSVACPEVGAARIVIRAIEENSAFGHVVGFDCDDRQGVSQGLPRGVYRLDIDLRTDGGESLLSQPLAVSAEVVPGQDSVVPLQSFSVPPQGLLSFQIAALQKADNCIDAGIDAFRISLLDSGGACVETLFSITTGQDVLGYQSDCVLETPCFEMQSQVSANTSSGFRTMEVVGLVGGLECWQERSQFTIPGNDLSLSRGIRSVSVTNAEGCPP